MDDLRALLMTPPSPLLMAAALGVDLLLGDPRCLPHPVVAIGRLIRGLESLLQRCNANGYAGGLLLCLVTVAASASIGTALLLVTHNLHQWFWWLSAVWMAWTCLALRSLHAESALVAAALERGDLPEARRFLSYIVGRDTAELDESAVWRATIETVAENASDGVIAPMFWLTLGGPVAALSYKAASTLDSMVGYHNQRYERLGWASARLDDLLNLIPARLTALLIILSAPLVGFSGRKAWHVWRRDRFNHASPNSGQPEAAAAGALGVRLGGPSSYGGISKEKPFIGDPASACNADTYRGMIRLLYASTILMMTVCALAHLIWSTYVL